MGCDIGASTSTSPWDRQGITYEDWFTEFPVSLRDGLKQLTCGKCGALVAERAAKLHLDWHNDDSVEAWKSRALYEEAAKKTLIEGIKDVMWRGAT